MYMLNINISLYCINGLLVAVNFPYLMGHWVIGKFEEILEAYTELGDKLTFYLLSNH